MSIFNSQFKQDQKDKSKNKKNLKLTPVAHFAYITPFHSPSMEQKDFLSFGGLQKEFPLTQS